MDDALRNFHKNCHVRSRSVTTNSFSSRACGFYNALRGSVHVLASKRKYKGKNKLAHELTCCRAMGRDFRTRQIFNNHAALGDVDCAPSKATNFNVRARVPPSESRFYDFSPSFSLCVFLFSRFSLQFATTSRRKHRLGETRDVHASSHTTNPHHTRTPPRGGSPRHVDIRGVPSAFFHRSRILLDVDVNNCFILL